MGSTERQNSGPQSTPDVQEVLNNPEAVQALEEHVNHQQNTMNRAELAQNMGADDLRNTAVTEVAERENSRSAEQVRTALNGVLSKERLASLSLEGVNLWRTGGNARIETNHGFEESSGDNEQKRMMDINKRIHKTAAWGMRALKGKDTYVGLDREELIVNMPLLKDDLVYLSHRTRTEEMIPEGNHPKAQQFKDRAEFFGRYRAVLKEILDTVHPPHSEKGQYFSAKYGGIMEKEQLEKHCTDPENLKGSLQVIAMMGLGILFAVNAFNDLRKGKVRLITLLMLGGIVALAGKDSKYNMLTSSNFSDFSKERLTRKKAEGIMNLKATQKSALLSRFKKLKGSTITKENMRPITHPKTRGVEREDKRLVEVVEIFEGMNSAIAHTYLNGLVKMSRDKNKRTGLDFIEALEQDPGTTENMLADVKSDPVAAQAAIEQAQN